MKPPDEFDTSNTILFHNGLFPCILALGYYSTIHFVIQCFTIFQSSLIGPSISPCVGSISRNLSMIKFTPLKKFSLMNGDSLKIFYSIGPKSFLGRIPGLPFYQRLEFVRLVGEAGCFPDRDSSRVLEEFRCHLRNSDRKS